jgi:rod shape-determining protein MreD
MNLFQTILILAFAFLAVFAESVFSAPRHLLGAQIDLLPALMVFAALSTNLFTVSLLAIFGGLWFDSLSANPFGITILPLFAVGFLAGLRRDLILRDSPFAQFVLGAAASALVPALVLLLLLNGGKQPPIGWGTFWQLIVMTAGGAAVTPAIFSLFAWCDRALGYQPRAETSFRPDREIRRGRNK